MPGVDNKGMAWYIVENVGAKTNDKKMSKINLLAFFSF